MPIRNEQISALLKKHIDEGEFPSAVYLVGERDQIVYEDALGYSVVEPYRVANKIDTIYDLASLTKPLVTSLLCARLIELGELTLDSSVSHYLPEFDRTDKQMITIRELLTHTSGLPAWRPSTCSPRTSPIARRARSRTSISSTSQARVLFTVTSDSSRSGFCWTV